MRIRYILLFIMLNQAGFSQVTLPPFYGLFADGIPPPSGSTLLGGNAVCDGTQPTTVVPITSTTGRVWMDRNLGASRAATSSTDYEAYGCLYQWGRGNDGHASISWISSTTGTPVNGTTATLATADNPGNALFIKNSIDPRDWRSDNNDTRWQGLSGVNNPCPVGYRLPTNDEMDAEFTNYGITDAASAYDAGPGGGFRFVLAGYRGNINGAQVGAGTLGSYWNSATVSIYAYYRTNSTGTTNSSNNHRALANSVRCIKDLASLAICDGSAPTPVVPIVSSTGRTWMDRNLGASRAATSSTDYLAYGCLYQWGRGNDGHASLIWASAILATPVNGNTYTMATTDTPENALFIIVNDTPPLDWRSDNNNTRWQGLSGTNNPCPSGYRVPTDAELNAEFTAYGITNAARAYTRGPSGGFKFTLAGFRLYGGLNSFSGANGYYWSSTINGSMSFNSEINSPGTSSVTGRQTAFSVRCIK